MTFSPRTGKKMSDLTLDLKQKNELIQAAKTAAKNAYAPYSGFPVGAAIMFEDGAVLSGCNVENSSIGLSICAERNAMTTAVANGAGKPVAVAIAGKENPCTPCGACRQFLAEFNPEMFVILEENGKILTHRLDELLPHRFELSEGESPK